MALFKIRGADGREYGPVVGEQICQWIAERRVLGSTLSQVEGSSEWLPIASLPEFSETLRRVAPPVIPSRRSPMPAETTEDTLGKVIPFQNPKAIWAYYLGLSSIIPGLGIFLGLAAVVLGVQGLLFANKNPGVRGHVHSWVGILVGGFFCLLYLAMLLVLFGAGFLSGR